MHCSINVYTVDSTKVTRATMTPNEMMVQLDDVTVWLTSDQGKNLMSQIMYTLEDMNRNPSE